jgi:arginine decarboxylase
VLTPTGATEAGSAPEHLSVVGAVAAGSTSLAAFHRALSYLDASHYNLIRLSSVIPPGVLVAGPTQAVPIGGSWGDRLFCVFAEQRTSTPGEEAWAGVGWVQRLDGGGGLLVEHEGSSEGYVREAITKSLEDMVTCDPSHHFSARQQVVVGGRCESQPICALVLVPFATAPWTDDPTLTA